MKKRLSFAAGLFSLVIVMNLVCFSASCQSMLDFIGPLPLPVSASDSASDLSLASILPQAAILKSDYQKLEEKVNSLRQTDSHILAADGMIARLADLKKRLFEMKAAGSYGFEQIADLRSQTRSLLEQADRQAKEIAGRLEKSQSLKLSWNQKETAWKAHGKELVTGSAGALAGVVKDAELTVAEAKKQLEGIEIPLVSVQKKAIEIHRDCQGFIEEIDQLMNEMRKDLFRRSRPAMFTPAFIFQFDHALWQEFWMGVASFELPDSRFFASYGWVFFLQLILIGIFVYFFRSLQKYNLEQLRLGFLLQRYISASILLGILVPLPLFEELPKLIKLFLAAVVSVNGARLLAGRIETEWRRRVIYSIVGVYLTVQFFSFISFPAPALRVYIAIVSIFGSFLCFWRAQKAGIKASSPYFIHGVKLAGLMLLLVFLCQAAGYVALGNYLLDVSIKTVFLGLIAWMINLIIKGAIEVVFDNSLVRKSRIVERNFGAIIRRLWLIADVMVIFFCLSGILSVWGYADNTLQSAQQILQWGFSFQGKSFTLGLLVLAASIIYLAFFFSWLLQCILEEEVYPRRKVERGVGISINRLIHYAFVVIGVSMAFSAVGIGMQNLTVIVGALGIGIGFGLQNIVNNFASGLILLFERSVKVGDIVQINGEWGIIKNLGLRATVVESFDHSEMIVPNSDLVSTRVTNWTLSDRQVRLVVKLGVAYGSDIDLVTKILYQIAQENPFVMKVPEPAVLFMEFGASSLDFELRVWVADIDNRTRIKSEINCEIDRLFRENNIEIPFSQHDLHLRSIDEPVRKLLKTANDNDGSKYVKA
jgi:small-conductance mechanosensitive channel